jgi:ubiquinone/menaquinone biosynthesis C-methylase UbiE
MNKWDDLAEWWDNKQGENGDLWHRTLIDPAVLRILGDVSGKDVLDLGCGNGYFSRRLASMGARVTGIDSSAAMIEKARQHETREHMGVVYNVADASHLTMIPDRSFDVVLSNMALDDVENAEGAIRECARVLRKNGRLVASISHPCFDMGRHSGWLVEKIGLDTTVWRKVDSHYRTIFEDTVEWGIGETERWKTKWYHRPLSWYIRTFRDSGFAVTALEEPEPTDEFLNESNQPWIKMIPLHCVFEAHKMQA